MMRVGLVCSGGMGKGAFEIGALQAVAERFAPGDIPYISAASIGALNSYAFSCGRMDRAVSLWEDINRENEKVFIRSVMNSDYLVGVIRTLAVDRPQCRRMYVPLFHLSSRNNYYINLQSRSQEKIESCLRAAVSLFPLCAPVPIDGKSYIDGGLVDNIPVYPLLKHELDYVICIYFDDRNYMFESEAFDKKVIKISFYGDHGVSNNFMWVTRENTEKMFEIGYRKAKETLDFIFSTGTDDREGIYAHILESNRRNTGRKTRLTVDVVVHNINKAAQRFTKKSIFET